MNYQKILVAIDRSPQANLIFAQALELAKKEQASLMLFHCLPLEHQGVGSYGDMFGRELINFSHEMREQLRKESEETREWLASYCEKATAQGVPTEWDLKVGDAGSRIRELAESWDADLVVVGRRGRRGLAEMVLGSVSNHVLHHVSCSVLVVQGMKLTVAETPTLATQTKS